MEIMYSLEQLIPTIMVAKGMAQVEALTSVPTVGVDVNQAVHWKTMFVFTLESRLFAVQCWGVIKLLNNAVNSTRTCATSTI